MAFAFGFAAGFLVLRPLGNNAGGHCRCGPSGTLRHVSRSRDNLTARLNSAGHNFRPQSHRFGDWICDRSTEGCVLRPPRPLCAAPIDALFVVLRLRDAFARFEAVFVARDALFVVLRLRDAFARFEAVFVARDAVFAAVRPRALPPPALARDLDAVVFAGVLLRVAAVLETVFLEAAVFFFLGAAVFFAAGRPRALIPPPDLEAVVFDDLAIHNSF